MSNTWDIWRGEKVRLRGWEPDDWQHDQRWLRDSEGARASGWIHLPESEAALRKHTEETALRGHSQTEDAYNFIVETLSGEAVGTIAGVDCDRINGTLGYALYIGIEARRNGYAFEAVLLLARYYFFERRYQKLNAGVYAFNDASARLQEKLGLQLEGRSRRGVFTNGTHHDVLHFGITAEEFLERHAAWLKRNC
ncbi:MAG TPA: GNAT family protein [Dehalococcoidia bacterium]|nr:GNAT family protein [Dehalococcoidia bacterium]